MTLSLTHPERFLLAPRQFGFVDHFDHFVTADRWTTIEGDSGSSIAAVDSAEGGLDLISGGTDNFEVYLHTTQELYLIADDKPMSCIGRLAFAEANTDDINVLFGFQSGAAANSLQDNAGGPLATYSGAVFFKLDGELFWRFETSLGGTQTTTRLAAVSPVAATDFHTLQIEIRRRDATTVEIIPKIDEAGGNNPTQALDANGVKVKHTITLGSPTEMGLICGVKSGGANAETLRLAMIGAEATR